MIVCKRSLYPLHVALLTNLMYVTFVMDINVRYISNFTFIWIFYFNMINSKSKTKKKCISYSGIGDPLLLFGEGMWILSSNSNGDGDIRKISGMGTGRLVPSPPLPIAIPKGKAEVQKTKRPKSKCKRHPSHVSELSTS